MRDCFVTGVVLNALLNRTKITALVEATLQQVKETINTDLQCMRQLCSILDGKKYEEKQIMNSLG